MSFYNTNPMYNPMTTSAQYSSPIPGTRPSYHQPCTYYNPVNTYPVNYRQPTMSYPYWMQGETTLAHTNSSFTHPSDQQYFGKNTVADQSLKTKPHNSPVYYKAPPSPTDLFMSKASGHAISVTPPHISPKFISITKDSANIPQEDQETVLKSPKEKSKSNVIGTLSTPYSPSLIVSTTNKNNNNSVPNTSPNKTDLFFERAWRLGIRCSKSYEEFLDSPDEDMKTPVKRQQSPVNLHTSQSDVAFFEIKQTLCSREEVGQLGNEMFKTAKNVTETSTLNVNANLAKIADNVLGGALCSSEKPIKTEESESEEVKSSSESNSFSTSLDPETPEFKPFYSEENGSCLSPSSILPFRKIPLLPEDDEEKKKNSNDFYYTEDCLYTSRNVDIIEMQPYLDELVDDQTQTDKVKMQDMGVATVTVDTVSQFFQTDDWTPTLVKVKTKNRRLQTGPELMPLQTISLPSDNNYAYLKALQREVYNLRSQICLSELQRELHSLNYSKSHWSLFFQAQPNTDTGLEDLVEARMKWLQQCITNIEGLLRDGLVRLDNGENLKDLPDLSVYIPTVSGNARYFPKSVMKDVDFEIPSPDATTNNEKVDDSQSDAPKCPGVDVSTQTDEILAERRIPEIILKEPERSPNAKKRKKDGKKTERRLSPTLVTIDEAPEMTESFEDDQSGKDVSVDSVDNSDNTSCLEVLEDPETNKAISSTNSVQIIAHSNSQDNDVTKHTPVIIDFEAMTNGSLQAASLDVELNVADKRQNSEINELEKKNLEIEIQNEEVMSLSNEAVSDEKNDVSEENPELKKPFKDIQESQCDENVLLEVPKSNIDMKAVNLIDPVQKQETNCKSQNVPKHLEEKHTIVMEEKQESDEPVEAQESVLQEYDPAIQKAVAADGTLLIGLNCQSDNDGIQNTSAKQSNGNSSQISETRQAPVPPINQDVFRAVKTQLVRDYPQLLMNPVYLENIAINQSIQLQNYIAMEKNANTMMQQIPTQVSQRNCLQQAPHGIRFSLEAGSATLPKIKHNQPPQQHNSGQPFSSNIEPLMQKPFQLVGGNSFTSASPGIEKASVPQSVSQNGSVPCSQSAQPSMQDFPSTNNTQKNQSLSTRMFSQHPEVPVSQLPPSLTQYQLPFHRQSQKVPTKVLPHTSFQPWTDPSSLLEKCYQLDQRSPSPKQLSNKDQATGQQTQVQNSSAVEKYPEMASDSKHNQEISASSHLNIVCQQLSTDTVCLGGTGFGKNPFVQQFSDQPLNNGTSIPEHTATDTENFLKNYAASTFFKPGRPENSNLNKSSKTSGTKKKSKKSASQDEESPKNPNPDTQDDWESEIDLFPETFQFKPESLSKPLNFGSNIGLDDFSIGELLPSSASSSKRNRPQQTKLNKVFLGRLLQGAETSNSKQSSTKPTTQDLTAISAGECGPDENPVDAWHTVGKKRDKRANKTVSSASSKNTNISGAGAKSQSNFEHLVQLLSKKIEKVTRPDVLFAVSEIRKKRGTLKGMPVLEIVDCAKIILKRKKSDPATDVTMKEHYGGQMTEISPRFRHYVQKDPFTVASVNDEGELCVICCDELTMESTKQLDCGHEFHTNCIREWVCKHERTCPTCRQIALFPEEFPLLNKTPHKQ